MSQTARVYKIERLIRTQGRVSFARLRQELEVSPATLKRDLAYLRDQLGAPIEYDRDANGYYFSTGWVGARHELPGLWFNEHELYALLMAHQLLAELDAQGTISHHLAPLLERIHQILGANALDARAMLQRVRVVSPARRPVSPLVFGLLAEALTRRRRVRMEYLTRTRGEMALRDVSPQRLVHHRNTWYLDAWCHTRQRLLRFALDAVGRAALLDDKARELPLRQVQAEMDQGYGVYAGAKPHWAVLEFAPHAAQWVSREEWHPQQQGAWTDDGRWRLKLPYTDPTELAMDVLRHADEVRIVEDSGPLRETVRDRARRAWAAHRGPEGGGSWLR
jgi:predicted DNA-binding transcriptional regulator YafY